VKAGDCGSTANGRSSDKLDDKPRITDPDLARVIDAWPHLPEPVKAGIVAMIQAARDATDGPETVEGGGKPPSER